MRNTMAWTAIGLKAWAMNGYCLRSRRAEMYLQHFGLRHPPLGKNLTEPWDDGVLAQLGQRFNWLLESPGIGLPTG
jgi:hypothetical protein